MIPSMSRPANPYDNAKCERFMRTLKQEEIRCFEYKDMEDLRAHLGVFFDRYYNATRLHSALGYRSPDEFERHMAAAAKPQIQPAPGMSFLRHEGDLPTRCETLMANNRSGLFDRSCLIVLDESPVRLFLASCSPALLASASPTATILDLNCPFVERKSANGNCLKTRLSHVRGSVQPMKSEPAVSRMSVP